MNKSAHPKSEKITGLRHNMFSIPDITDLMNSYQENPEIVEAQYINSELIGLFTPKVLYNGSGDLKEGLTVLYVDRKVGIAALKLPSSLKEIVYHSLVPIDRARNLIELKKVDRHNYDLYKAKYCVHCEIKNNLSSDSDSYSWPHSLKKLSFGNDYYHLRNPITQNTLPRSLSDLRFGHTFNQKITSSMLPPFLKKLDLGYNFNQDILSGELPDSLTHLRLGYHKKKCVLPVIRLAIDTFDEKSCEYMIENLKNLVAPNMTHLFLGGTLNCYKVIQQLNETSLPPSLIYVYFHTAHRRRIVYLSKIGSNWVEVKVSCETNMLKEDTCRLSCYAWDSDCEWVVLSVGT